jgi:uncharacterized protein YggT (Ycf19 family)
MLYNSGFISARSVSKESQVHKFIWWALTLVEILLFIRFMLEYFDMNQANTLTHGLYTVTQYILHPFTTLLTSMGGNGSYGWIIIVSIIGYLLLTTVLISLLKAKRSPHLKIECARALSLQKYSRYYHG